MDTHYDAIIIGTGQAGPALADRLQREGWRIAVIERARIGGTCVNVGCTPTKTLVASAKAAYLTNHAQDFGVVIDGSVRTDMRAVKARKDRIVGDSTRGLTEWLEGMEKVDLIRGHARFVGPDAVTVNGRVLHADKFFIDTGGRARVPDWPGLDQLPYLTNSSIMDIDFVPEHLIIIGGSYIGLEFAQMYRRFGSRVTVVEKSPRVIAREDADISDCVYEILSGEGVEFRLEAECISAQAHPAGVVVGAHCEGPNEIVGSHVLLAIGRLPNSDDLGLEAAGVETDERGYIIVDDTLRTSAANVWALGEVNGRGAFTHTSYNDYEIVAANLFDDDQRRVTDRIPCYGLFIDPPLGRVGMTEREARTATHNVLVGRRPMERVSRAKEFGETRGFIKVLVNGDDGAILGAAILGLHGDEVVHSLLDIMYARKPYTVIARAVHIHPTVTELIPTVLQNLESLD